MQTALDIQELQQELKELLTEGIGLALQALKDKLPPHTARYNEVIQLEGRLKEANMQRRQGILSYEQLQLTYSRLRQDVLDLVDDLQTADFQVQNVPASAKTSKRGSILYRIPTQMQLERETRCIVRIAFLEEYLLENIELDADTKIQSIRIAEVMGVQLLDPNEQQAFSIRLLTEGEQFVDEDDYTEWIFNVKPLLEGIFSLMLKVTVIEEKRGKERKRDIVLEETIEIVTTTPVTDEPFKTADYQFQRGVEKRTQRSSVANSIRRFAGVMVGILFVTIGGWAIDVPQIIAWQQAKNEASVTAYENYLQKYPGGRHVEQAMWNIAALEKEGDAYEDYLELFPNGAYQQEAKQALAQIRSQLDNTARDNSVAEQEPLAPPPPNDLLAQDDKANQNPLLEGSEDGAGSGDIGVPDAAAPESERLPIQEKDLEEQLSDVDALGDTLSNATLENADAAEKTKLEAKIEANADYQYLNNRTATILRAYENSKEDYLSNSTFDEMTKDWLNKENIRIKNSFIAYKDCMIRQFKGYVANDRNYDELLRNNILILDYMDDKLIMYESFYGLSATGEEWQGIFATVLFNMDNQVRFLKDKVQRMGCLTE